MRDPTLEDRLAELLQRGYGYALALAGEEHAARDLVHDACVRLLRRDGPYEAPYLFRAIRNGFIDGLRRRERVRFVRLDTLGGGTDDETDPYDPPDPRTMEGPRGSAHSIDGEALAQAMAALPPSQREILWLHAVEGRTGREIAALTDRPRNTVLSLLQRAKARLRERLRSMAPPSTSRADDGSPPSDTARIA